MNVKDVIIRKENLEDYEAVFELNKITFGHDEEANLVNKLRKGSSYINGLALVAEYQKRIVGYILFTKVKIIDKNGSNTESLALAPMAVEYAFQRMGIGSKLVKEGLKKAKKLGYYSVIVLGHKEYYPKFGFKPASNWKIEPPFDIPDEVFMAKELKEGELRNVHGIVKYDDAFENV